MSIMTKRGFEVRTKVAPEVFQEIILSADVEMFEGYVLRVYRLSLTWFNSKSSKRNSYSPMRVIFTPNEMEILTYLPDFFDKYIEESKGNGCLSPEEVIAFLTELGFKNKTEVR